MEGAQHRDEEPAWIIKIDGFVNVGLDNKPQ